MTTPSPRQVLRLDPGWRFHLGEVDSPLANKHIAAYMANKAGWARGPAKPSFDDSDWRIVDLPHDWAVEGPFDPGNHVNQGFLPRGVGWYRRHFRLEESDRGKYLAIQFDGVATHCTIYVNGHLLHRNFCGYTPFVIDISDIANFGDELNVIAVRVDANYMEGWWYEGAGIYRHVWLIKASPVHFTTHGIFVNPVKLDAQDWLTQVELTVQNDADGTVHCEVFARFAGIDDEAWIGAMTLSARASATLQRSMPTQNPALWTCDSPRLHEVQFLLRGDGRLLDDKTVKFGYRTIRFDPDQGFFLNDEPVKLKGTCNHQDHAGVGVAVPDSVHEFRIRRLKDMGCNAYRCAHNPPAPELLDACDRLGMLVMDENRNFGSSPEHLNQLRTMVLRDRNHPSVILWSICNEEAIQGTRAGAKIARTMVQEIKRLDPTRPVTAAVSGGILNDDCIADSIDVMGLNYQLHLLDPYHAKHPQTPLLSAETHCAMSTRGIYQTDPSRYVFSAYDQEAAFWGASARTTWREVSSRPFVAGLFAWTGFDYRGEPTPHAWPCISTHWGILDTCGFEKDAFFLHKAWFTSEPFVHILPHWNWSDGQTLRVMTYTNCDEVELLLNSESLGRKRVDPIEMAQWEVPFGAGELRAVGYRENKAVAERRIETTGPAVALGLEVHPSFARMCANGIPADGEFAMPVTIFAVDAAGRRVPTADDHVRLSIEGPAKLLGVGNGDPTCHEPDKGSARSLFHGLAQAIVQTTTTAGPITITATAPDRRPATLRLNSISAPPRPAVLVATVRHFITDWRMSPITTDPPDVNQPIPEQDMNSWERIDPAQGPQIAWNNHPGYAIYRATFTPPRIIQAHGGCLRFHRIIGRAEVFIHSSSVGTKADPAAAPMDVDLAPGHGPVSVSVLLDGTSAIQTENGPGITGPVEIVPA